MQSLDRQEWLTTKEACKLVDRTRTTVNNWAKQGLVEVQKVGEKPLYSKSDLLLTKDKKENH